MSVILRSLVRLSVLCALLLVAPPSHAQSVEVSPATFKILREVPRSAAQFQYTLNYSDCMGSFNEASPTVIQIKPVLKGFDRRKSSLEVWVAASQDCTKEDQRKVTGSCGMVATVSPQATGQEIRIRPADVIEALRNPNSSDTDFRDAATPETCESDITSAVRFYIMLLEGGQVQGSSATWDKSEVDISPPSPATGLKVNPGDKALFPTWDASDAVDLQGFRVFCERISCDVMMPDPMAGMAGAPGAAGAPSGSFGPSCLDTTGVLQPRKRLTAQESERYRCAYAQGRFAASAQVFEAEGEPIENDACYAIALSGLDLVLNESVLSDVMCATPKEVTTFFEGYREAGGKGGGGLCGIARERSPAHIFSLTLLLGGALFVARRARQLGGRK